MEAARLIWSSLERVYYVYNYEWADPRTAKLPLIQRPFSVFALAIGYVLLAKRWGPWLMRNRRPLSLRGVLITYNVVQIVCNALILYIGMSEYWLDHYSWRCQAIDWSMDPKAVRMTHLTYAYFVLKVFDLLDTMLFVLRKRNRQISTLHVTHHFGMFLVAWHGAKFYPGGHSSFVGMVNTFVHVIMYAYYLVSVVHSSSVAPWWKKHITQIQMVQHSLIALHAAQLLVHNPCGFPMFPVVALVPLAALIMYMFVNFYIEAYCSGGAAHQRYKHVNGGLKAADTAAPITNGVTKHKTH